MQPSSPDRPSDSNPSFQHAVDLMDGSNGVTKNLRRAKTMLERLVLDAHVDAMWRLGKLLVQGEHGITKDFHSANRLFLRAINAGSIDAINSLAVSYNNGAGVEKNLLRAKFMFETAANRNCLNAMSNLAHLLLHGGDGVPRNPRRAIQLYEKAVQGGSTLAMNNYALHLEAGSQGIPKDVNRAIALYERAITDANAPAMYNFAALLNRGAEGVPKDPTRAKALYERAIQFGYLNAFNSLALLLLNGDERVQENVPRAIALLERAVDDGDDYAAKNLAMILLKGRHGTTRDIPRAVELYERAVVAGNVSAMNNLASLLYTGCDCVRKDVPRALALFQRAAAGGDVEAMTFLGSLLEKGVEGLRKDVPYAKALYERATKTGHVGAMKALAALLSRGDGVQKDVPRAKALLEQAAEKGDLHSLFALAVFLESGGDGVAADRELSAQLLLQAAKGGYERAKEKLTTVSMEIAFSSVLRNPDILDEAFLLQFVRQEKVRTAVDLVAGHNMILLAIRVGVLTRQNIHVLGGNSWYLEDNLYLPASKLATENAMLIDAIFHHAESVGIIKSGYVLRVAREIQVGRSNDMMATMRIMEEFASRISAVEMRVNALEDQVVSNERSMQSLREALQGLCVNQDSLQDAVMSLSGSLTGLQKSIRKQQQRRKYACLAQGLLCLIPMVGSAAGGAVYAGSELFFGITAEALTEAGVAVAGTVAENVTMVDLSNFQVATYAFSESSLSKLDSSTRQAVTACVESSGFRNLEELRELLREQVAATARDSEHIASLDLGNAGWVSEEKRQPEGRARSSVNNENGAHEKARKHFEFLAHGREDKTVEVAVACTEINRHLKDAGLSEVPAETLENLFFELAEEAAEVVTETVFLGMLSAVREEQLVSMEREKAVDKFGERFRMRAEGKPKLSLRMTARVLYNFLKEMREEGLVRRAAEAFNTERQLVTWLKGYIDDGNGQFDIESATRALTELLTLDSSKDG